jgi:hypothetical protein
MSPLININLNNQIFPGNFAAHLAQSSPGSPWPKRVELFWAEPDLAFFPVCAAAHLESQRCSRAFLAETDLSACGFTRQITLIDNIAPRSVQLIRQPLKQKFAFNFPIVSCSSTFLHKANMLNAMSLLSRFSHTEKSPKVQRVALNALRHDWKQRLGRHHRYRLQLHDQVSARWKNSCNAPAAAMIGQAEIATMITKNSASTTNSKLFSLAK